MNRRKKKKRKGKKDNTNLKWKNLKLINNWLYNLSFVLLLKKSSEIMTIWRLVEWMVHFGKFFKASFMFSYYFCFHISLFCLFVYTFIYFFFNFFAFFFRFIFLTFLYAKVFFLTILNCAFVVCLNHPSILSSSSSFFFVVVFFLSKQVITEGKRKWRRKGRKRNEVEQKKSF